MPHEYIVTSGPGSNVTTSWRAVSKSRTPETPIGLDPGQPQRRVRLVPDVEGDTDRGERLDRRSLVQAPGVERPQPSHLLDQPDGGRRRLGVVRTYEHVSFQPRFEVLHFRRRKMVEGRRHSDPGSAAWTAAATEPRGGISANISR